MIYGQLGETVFDESAGGQTMKARKKLIQTFTVFFMTNPGNGSLIFQTILIGAEP